MASQVIQPTYCGTMANPFRKLAGHVDAHTLHTGATARYHPHATPSSSTQASFRSKKASARHDARPFKDVSNDTMDMNFILSHTSWLDMPPSPPLLTSPTLTQHHSVSMDESSSWAREFDTAVPKTHNGTTDARRDSPQRAHDASQGAVSARYPCSTWRMPVAAPVAPLAHLQQAPVTSYPSQQEWDHLFDQVEQGQARDVPQKHGFKEKHVSSGMNTAESTRSSTSITRMDASTADAAPQQPLDRMARDETAKNDENAGLDAQAWTTIAYALQESDQEDAAVEAFKCALDLDCTVLDAWLGMAFSLTNQRERRKVYECLENWLLQHGQYRHLLVASTHNHENVDDDAGRHAHLVSQYLAAARLGHMDSVLDIDVQLILGLLFYLDNDLIKARDCFQTAVLHRPEDHRLWNHLGAIHAALHPSTDAVDLYKNALHLHPTFVRAHYNLAIAYMNDAKYKHAAHHLVTALACQQQQLRRINAANAPRSAIYASPPTSTSLWSSLRLVMYLLNEDDLARSCNQEDLTPFHAFLRDPGTAAP
ncbi:hypothetical protein BC940DRAFT_308645 [Gongronella butleri]|nr:hypothetical protein BC940DRAFT_308645 [Gongronella butleri]